MAVQITEENLDLVAKVTTNGGIWVDADGTRRILYSTPGSGDDTAEVGDYVISDGAGRFKPAEKEIFELEYEQLYQQ